MLPLAPRRSTACAMLLLAEGADPFLVDRRQLRTALHYAAAFGQVATLRALLSEGTLVDTAAGRVALRDAKVCDMSGICTCGYGPAGTDPRTDSSAHFLCGLVPSKQWSPSSGLHTGFSLNRVRCCRYVDTRSENGYTAVHLAALSGTLACVQALLDSGASMMVRTKTIAEATSLSGRLSAQCSGGVVQSVRPHMCTCIPASALRCSSFRHVHRFGSSGADGRPRARHDM